MVYQRGEHGMEQAHGGYSGGMRRSQSLVQGLFGWISPFHHTGPEPPASSSMDEDGNDDANETFTEASETPLALDPPASPSPDTSLRTNPSPYAHASHGLRTKLARLWHLWHSILAHSKRQRSVRRTSHSQRLPLPSVQRARQAVGTHRSISVLALPHAGRTRLLGQA